MMISILLKQFPQTIPQGQTAGQQQSRCTLQDKATDKLNASASQQLAYHCCLSHVVPVRKNKQQIIKNHLFIL